eukprot:2621132-Amphidinium_carterae.1
MSTSARPAHPVLRHIMFKELTELQARRITHTSSKARCTHQSHSLMITAQKGAMKAACTS